MRVETLGSGTPEIAVVGAIHGDEPCGARAIERFLATAPPVTRPVKLIIANEAALARGVRYLDADLNRAFSADDSGTHEHQLAEALRDELAGMTVLAIHSTQSHPDPFALTGVNETPAGALAKFLSVVALVRVDTEEGRMFAIDADLLEIEAGYQGSDAAAENAYRIIREFLTATDVLPGDPVPRELPVFQLGDPIEKQPAETYEVYAENFAEVTEGESFAAADGQPLIADRSFYPILMSAYGYDDIFGYAGESLGTVTTA